MDNEDLYRCELRKHFMGNVNSSKSKGQNSQYFMEKFLEAKDEATLKYRDTSQPRSKPHQEYQSGGDADRALNQQQRSATDTYRSKICDFSPSFLQELKLEAKHCPTMLPGAASHKYHHEKAKRDIVEWESKVVPGDCISEGSIMSHKSSKTTMSWKDLRKLVKSQCKLHEVIDESLKELCNTKIEPAAEDIRSELPTTLQKVSKREKGRREEAANYDIYQWESSVGVGDNRSERSTKSPRSSKTGATNTTEQELRQLVQSQCKLHEVVDESMKQLCGSTAERALKKTERSAEPPPQLEDLFVRSRRTCRENLQLNNCQKDVMTQVGNGEFLDYQPDGAITVSVDDVVDSKVINPLIRKVQRMYMNNLRQEMALMDELTLLPQKVNEVYNATIFKQKE